MELLIVVTIMSVIAAMVVPSLRPSVAAQLEAAGSIVVADLDYARQLAVVNQSQYTVEFAADGTRYTVTHSGSNNALDKLPNSPFRRPNDPVDQHIGRFGDLPQAGLRLEYVLLESAAGAVSSNRFEFDPLGSLRGGDDLSIWLAGGTGRSRFYLPVNLNAVTGLATLGEMTSANPAQGAPEASEINP